MTLEMSVCSPKSNICDNRSSRLVLAGNTILRHLNNHYDSLCFPFSVCLSILLSLSSSCPCSLFPFSLPLLLFSTRIIGNSVLQSDTSETAFMIHKPHTVEERTEFVNK